MIIYEEGKTPMTDEVKSFLNNLLEPFAMTEQEVSKHINCINADEYLKNLTTKKV